MDFEDNVISAVHDVLPDVPVCVIKELMQLFPGADSATCSELLIQHILENGDSENWSMPNRPENSPDVKIIEEIPATQASVDSPISVNQNSICLETQQVPGLLDKNMTKKNQPKVPLKRKLADYMAPKISNQTSSEDNKDKAESFECKCCYNEVFFEDLVQCADGHLFCMECLRKYTEESVYGQGKRTLMCMSDGCDQIFPASQLIRALPEKLRLQYEDRIAEEVLNLANLENLSRCPFCNYQALLEDEQHIFACPNPTCQKRSCRKCGTIWEEHDGLECNQIEKEAETKIRTDYEEKMANARIRDCPSCKARFTKESGCNKITCRCGTGLCYICRMTIKDYDHFCQHVRNPGKKCTKCQNCFLWTDAEYDDELAISEIKKQATQERVQQGFEEGKEIGVPGKPTIKLPKNHRERGNQRRVRFRRFGNHRIERNNRHVQIQRNANVILPGARVAHPHHQQLPPGENIQGNALALEPPKIFNPPFVNKNKIFPGVHGAHPQHQLLPPGKNVQGNTLAAFEPPQVLNPFVNMNVIFPDVQGALAHHQQPPPGENIQGNAPALKPPQIFNPPFLNKIPTNRAEVFRFGAAPSYAEDAYHNYNTHLRQPDSLKTSIFPATVVPPPFLPVFGIPENTSDAHVQRKATVPPKCTASDVSINSSQGFLKSMQKQVHNFVCNEVKSASKIQDQAIKLSHQRIANQLNKILSIYQNPPITSLQDKNHNGNKNNKQRQAYDTTQPQISHSTMFVTKKPEAALGAAPQENAAKVVFNGNKNGFAYGESSSTAHHLPANNSQPSINDHQELFPRSDPKTSDSFFRKL